MTFSLQKRPLRRWKVVKKLSEEDNKGGFNGGVLIVKDKTTGKEYIEKRASRQALEQGLIEQEIYILHFLGQHPGPHPFISQMVDHFVDKRRGRASIFMEFCNRGDLHKFIVARKNVQKELFCETDIWEWFIQLFEALKFCHYGKDPKRRDKIKRKEELAYGWNTVWHRDIKPANVLVSEEKASGYTSAPTMKLGDFGCAVAKRHIHTQAHKPRFQNSFQTRGWEPPEAPLYRGRSDVWQLGAIIGCMCNLVTLPARFDHTNPAPHYSEELGQVIKECMLVDVKRRRHADEVLNHIKKKYSNLKDSLEKNPSPMPFLLSEIEDPRQQRGFRNPAPNRGRNFAARITHGLDLHNVGRLDDRDLGHFPRMPNPHVRDRDFAPNHPQMPLRGRFDNHFPERPNMGPIGGGPRFGPPYTYDPSIYGPHTYEDLYYEEEPDIPSWMDPLTGLPYDDFSPRRGPRSGPPFPQHFRGPQMGRRRRGW